jgi:methionine-rich copper-binding protein CopC
MKISYVHKSLLLLLALTTTLACTHDRIPEPSPASQQMETIVEAQKLLLNFKEEQPKITDLLAYQNTTPIWNRAWQG